MYYIRVVGCVSPSFKLPGFSEHNVQLFPQSARHVILARRLLERLPVLVLGLLLAGLTRPYIGCWKLIASGIVPIADPGLSGASSPKYFNAPPPQGECCGIRIFAVAWGRFFKFPSGPHRLSTGISLSSFLSVSMIQLFFPRGLLSSGFYFFYWYWSSASEWYFSIVNLSGFFPLFSSSFILKIEWSVFP